MFLARQSKFLLLITVCFACVAFQACTSTSKQESNASSSSDQESATRKRARLRMELALNYFAQGKTEIALEEVNQALVVDPALVDAYNLRAVIYMQLGSFSGAEDDFRKALQINPQSFDTRQNMAWLYCQQSRFNEAFALFNGLLKETTYFGKSKTLLTLGICQDKAGLGQEAVTSLTKAFEAEPGNSVIAYNLAAQLFKQSEWVKAQFYLKRINATEQANAESLWLGIKVEKKLGQMQSMAALASVLKKKFPQSNEYTWYEREQYDK